MVRVIATFIAVWLAVGAIGVLIQALVAPVPNVVVSLAGLVIAAVAAAAVYRRRARPVV